MTNKWSVMHATIGLFSLSLISPVFGMAVEMSLAWAYGASSLVDAYRVAAVLIAIGMQLFFGQFITGIIVPLVSDFREQGREEEGWQLVFTVGSILSLLILPVVAISVIWPNLLQGLLGPGLSGDGAEQAQFLIRFFVVAFLVLVWTGVLNGILHAYKIFWVQTVSQILINVSLLLLVLSIGRQAGEVAIASGVLLGTLLGTLLYIYIILRVLHDNNIRLRKCIRFTISPSLVKALKLSIPIIGLIIAAQWYQVLITRVLSEFAVGTLANYWYAFKLRMLASLLPIAFVTVIFPILAEAGASGDMAKLKRVSNKGLKMVLFVSLPATAYLCFLSEPFARLVFGHGNMTSQGIVEISQFLMLLSFALPAAAANQIMSKISYSVKNTIGPFIQQIIIALGLTIFSIQSVVNVTAQGITLAYTLLIWISMLWFALHLQNSYRLWDVSKLGWFIFRLLLVTALGLLPVYISQTFVFSANHQNIIWQIAGIIVGSGFGLLVFLIVSYKLDMCEIRDIVARIKSHKLIGS